MNGHSGVFHVRAPWQLRWLEALALDTRSDPDLDTLLSTLGPGDVAYDVGANMGVFSILMAKAVGATGQIVAFEPQPRAFQHLLAHVALNALSNLNAFPFALSDTQGRAPMYMADQNVLSSLAPPTNATAKIQHVHIESGDRVRARHGLPVPRAIKIDVEGHEGAVIRGLRDTLRERDCTLVCCEIHPPLLPVGVTHSMIVTQLRDLGFAHIALHAFPTWSVAVCRKRE